MRDDVEALVAAWDKKTQKKAKHYGGFLEQISSTLAPTERAVALAPCQETDPQYDSLHGMWGVLCLTPERLIFVGRGQARYDLHEIAEINIYRGGGESFLVSLSVGGLIEVRVGSESSYYEIETQSATAAFWPALQEHWASAKDRPRTQSASSPVPGGIADELAKLAELRSQGVLSDEEFEEQKRRLLS